MRWKGQIKMTHKLNQSTGQTHLGTFAPGQLWYKCSETVRSGGRGVVGHYYTVHWLRWLCRDRNNTDPSGPSFFLILTKPSSRLMLLFHKLHRWFWVFRWVNFHTGVSLCFKAFVISIVWINFWQQHNTRLWKVGPLSRNNIWLQIRMFSRREEKLPTVKTSQCRIDKQKRSNETRI